MKRHFLTIFAALACCTAAWGQTDPVSGLWASKELSSESGYPMWVFEITPSGADSTAIRVAPESAYYNAAMSTMQPLVMLLTDNKLRFNISIMQLDGNDKIQQISMQGEGGVAVGHSGGAGSRLATGRQSQIVTTVDNFDLDFAPDAATISGKWFWRAMGFSQVSTVKGLPVSKEIDFEPVTVEDLRRRNIRADIARMGGIYSGRFKHLGRYTKELIHAQYAKEMRSAQRMRTAGITVGAIGASSILLGGLFIGIKNSIRYGIMPHQPSRLDMAIGQGIAIAGIPLLATGLGLYWGSVGLRNKTYKRFFNENADLYSHFDMGIGIGGASVSYNF